MKQFFFFIFNVDVGVEQGSTLSLILSAFYFLPIFYIFEKKAKNLKILVSFLSFVYNGPFISQENSLEKMNSYLFYNYNIISSLLKQFRLIIKYGKTEVFYFSKFHRVLNPSFLDLSCLGGSVLHSKDTWHYLRFIFNKKLSFRQHVKFYLNKALSTVKCMKMLINSMYGLLSHQKCLLYKTCVLLITLYTFLLWHYYEALLAYPLKELRKMQRRATL